MIIIKNNKYHNGSRPPKQNLPRLHTAQSIPVCVLFLGSSKLWLSFVLHKNTFNKQQQKRRADYVGVLRYELEKRFSTFLLSLLLLWQISTLDCMWDLRAAKQRENPHKSNLNVHVTSPRSLCLLFAFRLCWMLRMCDPRKMFFTKPSRSSPIVCMWCYEEAVKRRKQRRRESFFFFSIIFDVKNRLARNCEERS